VLMKAFGRFLLFGQVDCRWFSLKMAMIVFDSAHGDRGTAGAPPAPCGPHRPLAHRGSENRRRYATIKYSSRFGDCASRPDMRPVHCWKAAFSVTSLI
jgi:hypothetical protein